MTSRLGRLVPNLSAVLLAHCFYVSTATWGTSTVPEGWVKKTAACKGTYDLDCKQNVPPSRLSASSWEPRIIIPPNPPFRAGKKTGIQGNYFVI